MGANRGTASVGSHTPLIEGTWAAGWRVTGLYWATATLKVGSWYWRLSTVPRLLYIRRLVLWLLEKQDDLEINASVLMGSKFVLVLFMSLHWVGCFCFVMALWHGLNENSWPAYISDHVFPQYNPYSANALQHYLQIFYKALDMMTLTGVYFSPPDNALEVRSARHRNPPRVSNVGIRCCC